MKNNGKSLSLVDSLSTGIYHPITTVEYEYLCALIKEFKSRQNASDGVGSTGKCEHQND